MYLLIYYSKEGEGDDAVVNYTIDWRITENLITTVFEFNS